MDAGGGRRHLGRAEGSALGQAPQRLGLDLSHALRRQAEPPPGLAQRLGLTVVEPKAHAYHLALTLWQAAHGPAHGVALHLVADLLVGALGVAGQQISQAARPVLADRTLERCGRPRGLQHLTDLAWLELGGRGQLLVGRFATQLGGQAILHTGDPPFVLADVDRHPDRAGLVGQPALNCLPDPEGRVGGNLKPLR